MKKEMTPQAFGDIVKIKRIEEGLTQAQLSKLCGVKQPTISNLEKGNKVGADAIDKILNVLKIEDLPLSFPRRFIK